MTDIQINIWILGPLWILMFIGCFYDLIDKRIPALKEPNRPQKLRVNYSLEFKSSVHTNSKIFIAIDGFGIMCMPYLIYLVLSSALVTWAAILILITIITASTLLCVKLSN